MGEFDVLVDHLEHLPTLPPSQPEGLLRPAASWSPSPLRLATIGRPCPDRATLQLLGMARSGGLRVQFSRPVAKRGWDTVL